MKQINTEGPFPSINTKESTKNYTKYYIATNLMNAPQSKVNTYEKNIFQQVTLEYNTNKGPKYDQKGDLVKHSILGRADWFNKIKNGKKTQFDEIAIRQLPTKTYRMEADQRSVAKSDLRSIKVASSSKIKKEKREVVTTKNQLLEELDKIKLRLEINKEVEGKKQDELQPQLRRVVTKEERVMDRHYQTERFWNSFILKQSNKLSRDPSDCQLIQAEQYRSRLEAASAFETLKSDYERFGPRIWQMTLRQPEPSMTQRIKMKDQEFIVEKEQKFEFIVGSDIPNAFRESSVCGHKGSIEYVRKPNITYDDSEFSMTQVPFRSFRSDKYLLKKIDSVQEQFNRSFMPSINKTDGYDGLIILGKSQLDIERHMIEQDGGDGTTIYRKNIEKLPDEYTKDTVYQENFNEQTKLVLPPIRRQNTQVKKSGVVTERSDDSRLQDFGTELELK